MDIEEAKKERARLSKIIHDAEDRRIEEENQKLLGRFFKYSNSYSCPEGPQDRWWLYAHVIGATGGTVEMERFQTDKYGKIEVEPRYTGFGFLSGYEEITEAEYRKALAKVKERVASL